MRTLKLLGGWKIVARLQEAETSAREASDRMSYAKTAVTPANDDRNIYEWRLLHYYRRDGMDKEELCRLHEEGFKCVHFEEVNEANVYHFRR